MNKLYHLYFWDQIPKTNCLFSKVAGLESIFLKKADFTKELFPRGFTGQLQDFGKEWRRTLMKECYSAGYSAKTDLMKQIFLKISEIFLMLIAETGEGSWRGHLSPRFCQNCSCQPNSFQCFKYKVFLVVTSFQIKFFKTLKISMTLRHLQVAWFWLPSFFKVMFIKVCHDVSSSKCF